MKYEQFLWEPVHSPHQGSEDIAAQRLVADVAVSAHPLCSAAIIMISGLIAAAG